MTSQARAIELTRLNIHKIFGERDVLRRLEVMADLWVISGESLFVDPLDMCKTHEAISAVIDKFQSLGGPEDRFVELSACL
jgi:hypothetical protein